MFGLRRFFRVSRKKAVALTMQVAPLALAMLTAATALVAPVQVKAQQTPVAAYGFNEGSGTTLTDSSGANHGIISGATWTTSGRYGGALQFDGVNDRVTVPDSDSLDLTTNMTLEAWVYPTANLGGWDTILLKETPSNLAYTLYANTSANRPSVEIANPANVAANGTSKLSTNAWRHIAATYNGSALRLYINGSLVRTVNTTGPITVSNGPLSIGGNSVWGEYFVGRIDEIRIYDRVLTQTEIQTDMNTPVNSAPPDTTAPIISSTQSNTITHNSASITWATDELATSIVNYGTSAGNLNQNATVSGTRTAHSVPLSGLAASTQYFYQAQSCDAANNCASSSVLSFTTTAAPDTTAPVISNPQPSGVQPAGTTSVNLQVSTDENATCRYSTTNVAYASMTNTFATTGATAHSQSVTTADGQNYAYFVRCSDGAGNANTVSTQINFSVASPADTTAPVITNVQSTSVDQNSAAISWNTDESATSLVEYGLAAGNLNLSQNLAGTRTSHSITLSGLSPTTQYFYKVTSCDSSNNCASSSVLSFTTTAAPDTTAPVISNPQPSGVQPAGTTSVNLEVTTDENATCRYATADISFPSMALFAATGLLSHVQPAATSDGQSYSFFVRCSDEAGNANTASTAISFSVAAPADTTAPTVSITAPNNGATVAGNTTVTASAADNVGVSGVQFKLDGENLGAEDTTAPYSTSWSTGSVANGNYTLTAVARDAAGNNTTSNPVNVTVDNGTIDTQAPSVPQNLLGFAISPNQINLRWDASTDNVGVTGYRVYRNGVNIATVTTNSFNNTGLNSGSTHTYRVEAVDAANNASAQSDPTTLQTVAVVGSPLNVGHFHTPQYVNGKLVPWLIDAAGPFHTILGLQANWWLNAPDINGWPAYLTAAQLSRTYQQSNGAVPGSANSMSISALLDYYAYTGDIRFKEAAIEMGEYVLNQQLTPSSYAAYPSFPWAVGDTGDITPGGDGQWANAPGDIMPDKGAMIGWSLVELYKATGDTRYLNEAVQIANVLVARAVPGTATQSPWPFRVKADTGAFVDGLLSGNQSFAVRLFDDLIALGFTGSGTYQTTRDAVWSWMKTHVISDTSGNKWQDFFEDHSGNEDNPTQINALETARYLLEKKSAVDPNWFSLANTIINTVKANWIVNYGTFTAVGEQEFDMSAYNSHTARLASILAMFYEAGGPVEYKDEAYSSFAYSAYSVDDDGFADTYYNLNSAWSTDSGWADFTRHFIDGFGAIPEWAASNSNRLLRSSSIVQTVNYTADSVSYTTFDAAATDKLKLTFTPFSVQVNGSPISTWTWDAAAKVLVINRTTGNSVTVASGPDLIAPVRSNGTPTGSLIAGTTNATLSLTTSENATCRYATTAGTAYSSMINTFTTTGATNHATGVSGLTNGGSYTYYVRCSDVAGNANTDDYAISFSVAMPDSTGPVISAVTASNITATAATITWTTDENSTSRVEYGPTTAYGQQTPLDSNLVTAHSVPLTGLTANTLYHYRVISADQSGNPTTSGDFTFTTLGFDTGGLVAAYSMNEGTGTTVTDNSGTNNNGTISGAVWNAAGKYGSALQFDGVNDWVTVADANSLDLATNMTLMAWVNPTIANDWKTILMKERQGGMAYTLYSSDGANGPPSLVLHIGNDRTLTGPSNLPFNTWSHVAGTYDGATMRLYINGTQVASLPFTGDVSTTADPLRLGGNTAWGEYFGGMIDEVRIYNRVLSPSEIVQNMNTPI